MVKRETKAVGVGQRLGHAVFCGVAPLVVLFLLKVRVKEKSIFVPVFVDAPVH